MGNPPTWRLKAVLDPLCCDWGLPLPVDLGPYPPTPRLLTAYPLPLSPPLYPGRLVQGAEKADSWVAAVSWAGWLPWLEGGKLVGGRKRRRREESLCNVVVDGGRQAVDGRETGSVGCRGLCFPSQGEEGRIEEAGMSSM